MAGELKLKELCELYGISRRVIQGYESAGLITACGKTKYGHLVYDSPTVNRILFIRFLQDLGYPLRDIPGLLRLGEKELARELECRIEVFKHRQIDLMSLLIKTVRIVDVLSSGSDFNEVIRGILSDGEQR